MSFHMSNFHDVMSGTFSLVFTCSFLVGVRREHRLVRAHLKQVQLKQDHIYFNNYGINNGSVTTADSQRIRKDQNDLSNPGAQQRVKLFSAQRVDNFAME